MEGEWYLSKALVKAISNVCNIPLSQLLTLYVKEDKLSIKLIEDEHQLGLDT